MTRPEIVLQSHSKTYVEEYSTPILGVATLKELAVDVKVTSVSDSWTVTVERLGADGNWYTVWQSDPITEPSSVSISIGAGLQINTCFAHNIRMRWTPSVALSSIALSASILGK